MAAFVTLVGVARGLDPLVILQRVLVASVATACVVAAASRALEFLVRKHQKPWHGTRNSR